MGSMKTGCFKQVTPFSKFWLKRDISNGKLLKEMSRATNL